MTSVGLVFQMIPVTICCWWLNGSFLKATTNILFLPDVSFYVFNSNNAIVSSLLEWASQSVAVFQQSFSSSVTLTWADASWFQSGFALIVRVCFLCRQVFEVLKRTRCTRAKHSMGKILLKYRHTFYTQLSKTSSLHKSPDESLKPRNATVSSFWFHSLTVSFSWASLLSAAVLCRTVCWLWFPPSQDSPVCWPTACTPPRTLSMMWVLEFRAICASQGCQLMINNCLFPIAIIQFQ